MPTYDYKCTSCNTEHQFVHKMTDDFITQCPSCKEETLRRHITVAHFTFKGEGWASKEIRSNSLAKS